MMPMMRVASLALALTFSMSTASLAQMSLADLLDRHGVPIKGGRFDVAFDSYAVPTVPITPGAFATPLALMTGGAARERVDAAYAFGVLAGRTGRAARATRRALRTPHQPRRSMPQRSTMVSPVIAQATSCIAIVGSMWAGVTRTVSPTFGSAPLVIENVMCSSLTNHTVASSMCGLP